MKPIKPFEQFINENNENPSKDSYTRVTLVNKAVQSFEQELKMNGIKYVKERPHVFFINGSQNKLNMAIKLTKERFGQNSIIAVKTF